MNASSNDDFDKFLQLLALSENIKGAADKPIDEIAELVYMKLGIDLEWFDFESAINRLDEEVQKIIEGIRVDYGGNPYDKEKLKFEIINNRELNLHVTNALAVKRLINEIKEYDDLDLIDLELPCKVAELVSGIIKTRVRNDIIPLIHRGLYAEDIRNALEFWSSNATSENGKLEAVWQQEFSARKVILERIIGGHIRLLQSQSHVGNPGLNGRGDKISDYLFHHSETKNISLVEIKTPYSKLLGKEYRGTYSLSDELSGAIAQVLEQKINLIKNFYQKSCESDISFEVNAPKCYIIIGNLNSELLDQPKKKRAFEIQRHAVASSVTIITFDEIYDQFKRFNVAS